MKPRIPAILTLALILSVGGPAGATRTAAAVIADAKARVVQISGDLVAMTTANAEAKIKKAVEHVEALGRVLTEYDGVAKDPATAPIAAQSKDYRTRLVETLKTLQDLQKASSGIQARTTALIAECTAAEAVLADKVKAALAAQDPSAIPLLAAQAEKIEALVDPRLDALLADLKRAEQLRDVVERFDASGDWRAVETSVEAAAEALVEADIRARKAVFASCEQLALGDAHKRIIEASKTLKQLQQEVFKNIPALRSGTQQFFDAVKGLRQWHEHEIEKVRLALCDLDEADRKSTLGGAVVESIGGRISDEMVRRKNEILGAAKNLVAAIDAKRSGLTTADRDTFDKIKADIKRIFQEVLAQRLPIGERDPCVAPRRQHRRHRRCDRVEVNLPSVERLLQR